MSSAFERRTLWLRRYGYVAACALVSLGLAALAWYLKGDYDQFETLHRQREKEGQEMLALLVGGSTLRQELEYVRGTTRRIDENLVTEANLAENLWYFYKLEEQTKVRLPELHQLNSPLGDKSPLYRRVPYTLRVTGTYDQVAAFLLALETGPRLVKIVTFNLTRTEPGGSALSLDIAIELLGKR